MIEEYGIYNSDTFWELYIPPDKAWTFLSLGELMSVLEEL